MNIKPNEIKITTPVGVLVEMDKNAIEVLVETTEFNPVGDEYDFLEIMETETGFHADTLLNEYCSLFLNPDFYYEYLFKLIQQKQKITDQELEELINKFDFKD